MITPTDMILIEKKIFEERISTKKEVEQMIFDEKIKILEKIEEILIVLEDIQLRQEDESGLGYMGYQKLAVLRYELFN